MSVELSAGLIASLEHSTAPRLLLLRHADREAIEPGDPGVSTPLTELGERRALALRQHLSDRGQAAGWGLSSPLLRCQRTAELLGVSAASSKLLGAPGCFMLDEARGGEIFAQHGVEAVVRAHLEGESWGCMRSAEDGARLLLESLRERLLLERGTGIAISHDAIVMPTIAWLTGERFADSWLAPLDGAVVTSDSLVWRGEAFDL